jgi:cell division protease FtsH
MKQTQKTLALWAVIILLVLSAVVMFEPQPRMVKEISFNEFIQAAEAGKIEEITVQEDEYTGKFKSDFNNGEYFLTIGPLYSEKVLDILTDIDANVKYKKPKGPSAWQQFLTYFPLLLVVGALFYLFRSIQAGGGKAFTFGKSRAQLVTDTSRKVTFKDVAGVEESKEELQEIIDFLKEPKKFTRLGARIPKGVLLMGAPGTGKTLLARAIAGEANVPFFSISGSDFVEMFVGVGASRVRDLFEQGKKSAPCIIFIDEIDAVGRHRGSGLGGGHDEREQTLNQLLVEMDGFESNDGVIIIAATNRPDVLDPALLRPGRFDRRIVVPLPDLAGRESILKIHAAKVPLDESVVLTAIARGTPGFSGADLENLVNEAALYAARMNKKKVGMLDLDGAKDKVLMGTERKSALISEDEKKVTAYHEAGHALIAKLIPHTDPVHKVTIIPRGRALGLTQQLPEKDKYTQSKDCAEAWIAVAMGGRVAEELVFNQLTTGASNDIERATDIAKKMVCSWGMSEKLGPLTYGDKDNEQVFLGKDLIRHKNYSEATAMTIDEEIRAIVMRNYELARKVLSENRTHLDTLAKALVEFETLDAVQIDQLLRGEKIEPRKKEEAEKAVQELQDKVAQAEAKTQPSIDKPIFTPGPQGA